MKTPTIAAIASPPGCGGIGIIKISGPDAIGIAERTFHRRYVSGSDGISQKKLQTHRLYYGHIRDPENEEDLDEVLLFVMRAPCSYTREDIVEIQAHSGPAVMRNILELVLRQGARLAEAGEFTRRAFLNGRIDLTQAEAVIDLINAKTDAALRAAASQISGRLGSDVDLIRNSLSDILAHIEAGIDFPDEVTEQGRDKLMLEALEKRVADPIQKLMHRYREGHIYRDGFELAIVGRPNAGKSSLLNSLVEKDRAIVNPLPGTTRDLVDGTFQMQGIPFNITDTAGIHETEDPVEIVGITKARERIEEAHLILFVIDGSGTMGPSDQQAYECCQSKPLIYVINKIDLVPDPAYLSRALPQNWKTAERAEISALFGTGIDQLRRLIYAAVVDNPLGSTTHKVIPNLRHHEALEKCHQNVKSAIEALRENTPMELVAIDFHAAIGRLDEIIGSRVDEDLLDRIFDRFCIGK